MGALSHNHQMWRTLTADALLSHAREIAAGTARWAGNELRAAFESRVTAGEDPLGKQYLAAFAAEERRAIGATLTPMPIVQAMLGWALRQARALEMPTRVVDCGAGTGRFAIGAARVFPHARIVAVENDPTMLMLLKANLSAAGMNHRIDVLAEDFRSITLGGLDRPTLFIGNPPYVRHHQISQEWKRWYVDVCSKHAVKASQLAGLHLHFFAKVAELGRDGDYGCFITAAEWLDVGYGSALRSLLANGLGGTEIHILEPTAEAFPGTMSTAAITGFRIGRRPTVLRVRRVREAAGLDRLEGGTEVAWAQVSQTAKWSLLTYPCSKPSDGCVELGEVCRVHRGQVTGNNRVWIAGPDAYKLPQGCLKPTVTRAGELIRAEPLLADDSSLARVVDLPAALDELPREERKAVERFIAWAKKAGGAEGYIASHRKPWWAIRLRNPAPIVCTYMARRQPAFLRNRAGACLLNIAHGIYPREPLSENELLKLVDALRHDVKTEQGRTYSGGLTKFEPREIERIPIRWPA